MPLTASVKCGAITSRFLLQEPDGGTALVGPEGGQAECGGPVAGATLVGLGLIRGRQAWRVLRYQRNMRRLPTYRHRSSRIPVSRRKLFLGRGFRWTQRLRDTIRPEVQHYVQPGRLYRWARRTDVAWESVPLLSLPTGLLRTRAWWNPLSPLPPVGGKPAPHTVEPDEQPVWMNIGERVGHTLVSGTTRVGKTCLAEILITQGEPRPFVQWTKEARRTTGQEVRARTG